MCWSGPLWVTLIWDSLFFLDLCDFSLIKLGKFAIITFSNWFSIPCSFSYPSDISIIHILLHLMLSCSSLHLFSLSESFFFFLLFLGVLFYLVIQFTDLIPCFVKPASFQCVFQFRNAILHYLLALVVSFYLLFLVDKVCSEFIIVSL